VQDPALALVEPHQVPKQARTGTLLWDSSPSVPSSATGLG